MWQHILIHLCSCSLPVYLRQLATLLSQAIENILGDHGSRWEFCESLLKADILGALNSIISNDNPPSLELCCTATSAAGRLGAWHQVEERYGMEVLRPFSADIATTLLTSITGSDSAISTALEKLGVSDWRHECTPCRGLDWAASGAVDSLNDLYPLCGNDLQAKVMKAISRIVNAGVLDSTCWSLTSVLSFLERHFCIKGGCGLDCCVNRNRKPQPRCSRVPSEAATLDAATACVQMMTWRFDAMLPLGTIGGDKLLVYMKSNQDMWTSEVLSAILTALVRICMEGPAELTVRTSADFRGRKSSRMDEEERHLHSASHCLAWIIVPQASRPWGKTKSDWTTSKACKVFESMVTLEALKAGAVRAALRIYDCEFRHQHAHSILRQLTGSSTHGRRSLQSIAVGNSWPDVLGHLVEAAQKLSATAFELPDAQDSTRVQDSDKPDEARAEAKSTPKSKPKRALKASGPWLRFTPLDICKFVAFLASTQESELDAISLSPALSMSDMQKQAGNTSNNPQLGILPNTIMKLVSQITNKIKDGQLSSAVHAAPLIAALLGHHLSSDTVLRFNTLLIMKHRAVEFICVNLQSIASSDKLTEIKELLVVPILLARRRPNTREHFIGLGMLPAMLRIIERSPASADEALTFLCHMVCLVEVQEILKQPQDKPKHSRDFRKPPRVFDAMVLVLVGGVRTCSTGSEFWF